MRKAALGWPFIFAQRNQIYLLVIQRLKQITTSIKTWKTNYGMRKYTGELHLKQTFIDSCKLTLLVFLLFAGEKTFAQLSRIAIVNLADSNLIYKHVGFTGFKDKCDTFDCQFNSKQFIDKELTRLLSARYAVSLITIPNSLLSPNGSIYLNLDIKKEVSLWISGLRNQFDYIIFVETGEKEDLMDSKKQKLNSSGLYSRGNMANSWVAVYSTMQFALIRTSDSQILDYDNNEMDYILPIKEYQFSRDNVLIDQEMLPVIKSELIKLLDYKMEYFLTNSFLM